MPTPIARRTLLTQGTALGLIAIALGYDLRTAAGCNPGQHPDRSQFESGDLLFTKDPTAARAYTLNHSAPPSDDELLWQLQRQSAINRLIEHGNRQDTNAAHLLQRMSYNQFMHYFHTNNRPNSATKYHSATRYVTHVAIIDVDRSDSTYVIEACRPSVRRIRYETWLAGNACRQIWHARLDSLPPSERSKIASAARRYIDTPYSLLNWDFTDTSSFYCSKLVWVAVHDALDITLDKNISDPYFFLPMSPIRLLDSKQIVTLQAP